MIRNSAVETAVFLALIQMLMVYFIFGVYWETAMKLVVNIAHGIITDPPIHAWFEEILFQVPLIVRFTQWFPDVPVFAIYLHALSFLTVFMMNLLSLRLLGKVDFIKPWFSALLTMLFSFSLLSYGLIYIHIDIIGILLVGLSGLLYLEERLSENAKPSPWWILLFFLGITQRLIFGILTFLLLIGFSVLKIGFQKRLFKIWLWHGLIAASTITLVYFGKWKYSDFQSKIDQGYEYILMDRQAVYPSDHFTDPKDKIRHYALMGYLLLSDTAQLNEPFIKRVIDPSKFQFFHLNNNDFTHGRKIFIKITRDQEWIVAGFLLMILLSILLLSQNPKQFSLALLWAGGICLLLAFMAIKVHLYHRVLFPFLAFAAVGVATLLVHSGSSYGWKVKFLIFVYVSFAAIQAHRLLEIAESERKYHERSVQFFEKLRQVSPDKTLLLWDSAQDYFPNHLYELTANRALTRHVYMSLYVLAHHDFVQAPAKRRFGFSLLDWKSMAEKLMDHPDVYWLISPEFAEFLELYYRELYQIHLTFELQEDWNDVIPGNRLYLLCSTS